MLLADMTTEVVAGAGSIGLVLGGLAVKFMPKLLGAMTQATPQSQRPLPECEQKRGELEHRVTTIEAAVNLQLPEIKSELVDFRKEVRQDFKEVHSRITKASEKE